jgi:hypothetical protein
MENWNEMRDGSLLWHTIAGSYRIAPDGLSLEAPEPWLGPAPKNGSLHSCYAMHNITEAKDYALKHYRKAFEDEWIKTHHELIGHYFPDGYLFFGFMASYLPDNGE